MFAITEFSRSTQQAVCMLMSVVIVSFTLTLGAVSAQNAVNATDYSVTVTQLQ